MHSRKIIVFLFFSSVLLALFHDLSIRLNWYYYYPEIDIAMHLLGGFVVSLFAYVLVLTANEYTSPEKALITMIAFALLVSVGWEVFEVVFDLTPDAGINLETVSDIMFGLVGGLVGWCVATSWR